MLPMVGISQGNSDSLFNGYSRKMGIVLGAGPSFWKQPHFNDLLKRNNLPTFQDVSLAVTIGDVIEWRKVRLLVQMDVWTNRKSIENETLRQTFGAGKILGEYFIIRKKSFSLSPMAGVADFSTSTNHRCVAHLY